MKIAICGDIHYCDVSSIIKQHDDKYPVRLKKLNESLNWFETVSLKHNCDLEIFLGDFMNKPILNEYELTALKDISWNNIPKKLIVGNHESSNANLECNSAKALEASNFKILTTPTVEHIPNYDLIYLPYITELNRKALSDYFDVNSTNKKIIFSHNDLKGISFGKFLTVEGFELTDIEEHCDLFINGHIHNSSWITKKILNLGILSGKDFNEDAFKYKHNIAILDTDLGTIDLIENPYAFNFYKVDIFNQTDLDLLDDLKSKPGTPVLSIRCNEKYIDDCKAKLKENKLDSFCRVVIVKDQVSETIDSVEEFTVDYLEKFKQFVVEKLGNSDAVIEELQQICM